MDKRICNKSVKFWCYVFILFTFGWIGTAASDPTKPTVTPLPAEKAFYLTAHQTSETLTIRFHIASHHFLYRNKLSLYTESQGELASHIEFPDATRYQNSEGKTLLIYKAPFTLDLPLHRVKQEEAITVHYQGCHEKGFCYPPTTHKILLANANQKEPCIVSRHTLTEEASFSSQFPTLQKWLSLITTNASLQILLLCFSLGVLLSFTPCVLPMLPILAHTLTQKKHSSSPVILRAMGYIVFIGLVYAAIGIVCSLIGQHYYITLQHPIVKVSLSIIVLICALSQFKWISLNFLNNWLHHLPNSSFLSVLISALFLSPCATPAWIGMMTYIGQTGNLWLGGLGLFFMALGMGMPLLLILSFGLSLLPKSGPWMQFTQYFTGLLLLALAIWIINPLLSQKVSHILWGSLVLFVLYDAIKIFSALPHRLKIGMLLMMTLGISIVILFLSKNNFSLTQPLALLQNQEAKALNHFSEVTSVDDLKMHLDKAAAEKKPALLWVHAKWCVTCHALAKEIFTESSVLDSLSNTTLLHLDLTEVNIAKKNLQKEFNLITPPVLIFFNSKGQESRPYRWIGEISLSDFSTHFARFSRSIQMP